MGNIEKRETCERHLTELLRVVKNVFFSIIRVNLLADTAYILQSADHPGWENREFVWKSYLGNYEKFVDAEALEAFTSPCLLEAYQSGKVSFSKDVSYMYANSHEWLNIEAFLEEEDGKPYATVIVKKNTREHLQKNIIEQFVYNKCEHFAVLDARTNRFETFGGVIDGKQVPDGEYDNYATEVLKYAKNYVVPEDRVNVIRQMNMSYIQEQLEKKESYIFSFGIMDPKRGYVRKQLEYRYYDQSIRKILLLRTDVTASYMKEKQKQKELLTALKRACTDSLTGLVNHQGTMDEVSFYLKEDEGKSALMFIDMDDFKDVNDSLGHIAGDDLLRRTADILRSGVRSDDLVGRVGGDEFLVFLRNIDGMEEAKECAQRLCRKIHHLSVDFAFPISCSIGIAIAPEEGTDYPSLTESADKRVYRAKSRGKNQIAAE